MNTGTPRCWPLSMPRCDLAPDGEPAEFANALQIRVNMNPVAWKAPIASVRRSAGRYFAATAPVPELVAYQNGLRELTYRFYTDNGMTEPLRCPVHLDWVFRRQLPSYTSPTTGRTVTKHRQDLSNLVKAAEDAIQPHVIANDNQVMSMTARIDGPQSKDVGDPYVEFTVRWN